MLPEGAGEVGVIRMSAELRRRGAAWRLLGAIGIAGFVFATAALGQDPPGFTVHKLQPGQPGNTLLLFAGIQGDEPGGFNAAALLVTHYRILTGSVWVVPNLNFISIIRRSRGVFGDLNRKFARLEQADPEYEVIERVKELILEDEVDVVLNLHDGSGFYRQHHVDADRNPDRWGQSLIIDQEDVGAIRFGDLGAIARRVTAEVNRHIEEEEHAYNVKNTETALGNVEMSKTLTYFAVRHRKPAFGVEASKLFDTDQRAYYHLRIIESYMKLLGIAFERDFDLSPEGVRNAIEGEAQLALYGKRILLEVGNARARLLHLPFKKSAAIEFTPSNPLMTVVDTGNGYDVYHGNRALTRLVPDYFDYDDSIDGVTMTVDGGEKHVRFGDIVTVREVFTMAPRDGYRVNVIGFRRRGLTDEAGAIVRHRDLPARFSVDAGGHIFRVEIYRDDRFCGMVLVKFGPQGDLVASHPAAETAPQMLN